MHLKKRLFFLVCYCLLAFSLSTPAQNRQHLTLTGVLNDSNGEPVGRVAPVTYDVSVKLYDNFTGGNLYYTEDFLMSHNHGIQVKNGLMTIELGTGTTNENLKDVIATHSNLWVEIAVDGDILSRSPLSASPFVISQNTSNVSIRSNK